MNIRKYIALAILTTITGAVQAGDYDISASSNTRYGTLSQGRVDEGVVVNVRMVKVEPSRAAQAAGTGIGAALGAAAGSQINRSSNNYAGNYAATALVGVLGGVVGNVATDALAETDAQELIIRKSSGRLIVITQAGSSLAVGQAVYLVDSAGKTRVIPQ